MSTSISSQKKPHLNRIHRISVVLKIAVAAYLLVPLSLMVLNYQTTFSASPLTVFNHAYPTPREIPAIVTALAALGSGLSLLGIISFYRLLGWYEKGMIFSAANVAEMKRLGTYLVGFWIISVTGDVIQNGGLVFPLILVQILNSPWGIIGGAIMLVACVTEEARKLREEQDLTV